MHEYQRTVRLCGDPLVTIERAKMLLAQIGYRIVDSSPSSVTGERSSVALRGSSMRPIEGASPINVRAVRGRMTVEARFEGIRRVRAFLLRLLVGLAMLLGVVLGVTFAVVFDELWPVYLGVGLGAGIPLIQLPIHLLVTLRVLRTRTSRALDTLVDNLASLSHG
jgi:hypothetical protein